MTDRTENFFTQTTCMVWQTSPDRRTNPGTLIPGIAKYRCCAASDECGSFFDGQFHVGQHLVAMLGRNLGANVGGLIHRVAQLQGFGLVLQRRQKTVEN